jgi:hypothetical protein
MSQLEQHRPQKRIAKSYAMDRETIWEWTIKSDANRRYWGRLQERYYKRVKYSEIGIAVSSALVAALVNLLPNDLGIVGKIFAVISSVGTVVLTASQWKKELAYVSELKSRWSALSLDYELLWDKIEDEDTVSQSVKSEYTKIAKRRGELSKHDPGFSEDEALASLCYDEATAEKTNTNTN